MKYKILRRLKATMTKIQMLRKKK